MESFSNLKKSGSISPYSGGVWHIQKKRKTTDHQHRKKDQDNQDEKETPDVTFSVMHEETSHTEADETDNRIEKNENDVDEKPGRKIDLII